MVGMNAGRPPPAASPSKRGSSTSIVSGNGSGVGGSGQASPGGSSSSSSSRASNVLSQSAPWMATMLGGDGGGNGDGIAEEPVFMRFNSNAPASVTHGTAVGDLLGLGVAQQQQRQPSNPAFPLAGAPPPSLSAAAAPPAPSAVSTAEFDELKLRVTSCESAATVQEAIIESQRSEITSLKLQLREQHESQQSAVASLQSQHALIEALAKRLDVVETAAAAQRQLAGSTISATATAVTGDLLGSDVL